MFPQNADIGQVYTAPNGMAYRLNAKGLWQVITGKSGSGVTFTANPNPPTAPALADQWYDTINQSLKSWSFDGAQYFWTVIGNVPYSGSTEPPTPSEGQLWWNDLTHELMVYINGVWRLLFSEFLNSAQLIVSRVLPTSWDYSDEGFSFELFVDNPLFRWRTINPVNIVQVLNGNDNITVDSTENIVNGGSYVISDSAGNFVKKITVLSVLSNDTIRTDAPMDFSMGANQGTLSNTSFEVLNGFAIASNGDFLYSKKIRTLRNWPSGYLYIRRSSTGAGSFKVRWRNYGDTTWIESKLDSVITVDSDSTKRDELYKIPATGDLEFEVSYTSTGGATERLEHIALVTSPLSSSTLRVDTPTNVSPADQAIGITATPTLQGSAYRSLYAIAQGGAQFQVAQDDRFQNIVYNSSSDFLAGWVAVGGQTAAFKDAIFLDGTKTEGIIVGTTGVVKLTHDGGLTFSDGTPAAADNFNSVCYDAANNKTVAVGDSGKIQYSTNKGVAWTSATSGHTNNLKGVAIAGLIVLAVGASGQISRSVNGGVIWSTVAPANSYVGTFNSVVMDAAGNCIAVGTNGEIQTSSDFGQNWTKRSTPGASTASLNGVAMSGNYAVLVGATGTVFQSQDRGATWVAKTTAGPISTDLFAVDIKSPYAVMVGASGVIQSSKDNGSTWVSRPAGGAPSASIRTVALADNSLNYSMAFGDSGLVQHSLLLEGTSITSVTIPAGADVLATGQVYYWRCRYKDSVGFYSAWSNPTLFATKSNFNSVKQPYNLAPADASTNVSVTPTLQSGPFAVNGTADTHSKSRWQIATDALFTTIVYDSGNINDLLSHTVPLANQLTNQVKYWWRVLHNGATDGDSPWSVPTTFTAMALPNTPSILSPANTATNISLTPTIQGSAFSIQGNVTTQLAAQWQIATDSSFTAVVRDSGQSTSQLTSYAIPGGVLSSNTVYYARVRYKGVTTDWSNWSATVQFTTVLVGVAKPTVSSSNVTTSSATLQTSAFAVVGAGATDTHQSTSWEVRTAANGAGTAVFSSIDDVTNKLSISASGLTSSSTLYGRARHRGTTYGYGPWSDDVTINTLAPAGQAIFTAVGSYSFTVPAGVFSISAVCVGGGGNGYDPGLVGYVTTTTNGGSPNSSGGSTTTTYHWANSGSGGGGGALCYQNSIPVTPGQNILVVVGDSGQFSSFSNILSAGGGQNGQDSAAAAGGVPSGGVGFNGGQSVLADYATNDSGGGGAAGYAGNGGRGGPNADTNIVANSGAGGGARCALNGTQARSGGGGGVGLNGIGATGAGGYNLNNNGTQHNGKGGSGGEDGVATGLSRTAQPNGGKFGGGGGAANGFNLPGKGGSGGVRLIWGAGRSYPSNAA